jgi:hypothetical protein
MGLEATGLARDPRVAATSFLDNALSPIAQSPRSMMAPGPIRAPGLANNANGASAGFGGGGALSNAGGEWATLDALNPAIASAASQTGVPANLIKAMLAREGGFGKDKWVNSDIRPGDSVYAFNGIFKSTADSYGIDFNRMTQDDSYAVWAMGRVLQGIKQNNPTLTSWDDVAGYYFAGPNYNNPNWGDETGQNTVQNYKYGNSGVITRWHQLDGSTGSTTGGFGDGGAGSSIVDEAKQYTGVPYIWGHIPGASEDPWKTGWDCSGFTKFLSDKYGDGSLPAGSHQQYADTVAEGLLVSDPNQLQARGPRFLRHWRRLRQQHQPRFPRRHVHRGRTVHPGCQPQRRNHHQQSLRLHKPIRLSRRTEDGVVRRHGWRKHDEREPWSAGLASMAQITRRTPWTTPALHSPCRHDRRYRTLPDRSKAGRGIGTRRFPVARSTTNCSRSSRPGSRLAPRRTPIWVTARGVAALTGAI